MKKIVVLFICVLFLIGCAIPPRDLEKNEAEIFLSRLSYVYDAPKHQCFAVLKTTNGHLGTLYTFTSVDPSVCNQVIK